MTVWAIVPVKPPHAAKTRLASVLSPHERATLARRLLADTLAATLACHALAGTIVVGGDQALRAAATRSGAWAYPDPLEDGRDALNAAVAHGCRRATERGATAALILPADLPLLAPDVIARFLREAGDASVAIAPDRAGAGTNALLLRPPSVLAPAFGPDSRARHQERARMHGLEIAVVYLPELSRDLDTPDDLALLGSFYATSPTAPVGAAHV